MPAKLARTASFGSMPTNIQSAYLADPRLKLAEALQGAGSSTAPVQSNMEGIARMLQGALGGYQAGQVRNEYQAQGDQYNAALDKGFQTARTGVSAWINPDTGQEAIPAVAPGSAGLMAGLESSKSPYAKDLARQAMMAQMLKDPKDAPSNVQEWEYYNKLPKDQKDQYLTMKRSTQYVNLGDSQAQMNPGGGIAAKYPVNPKPEQQPGFMAEQERQKALAKSRAEAEANLTGAVGKGEDTIKLVDDLLADPGLSAAVGVKGPTAFLNFGNPVPGTDAANFTTRLDQLKGQQFLQAFETLKGGGQITEVEGTKATNAIARMNTAQSEKDFRKAAKEFQDIVRLGISRAKQKAAPPSGANSNDSWMQDMPDPSANKDKMLEDDKGNKYVSDGQKWNRK